MRGHAIKARLVDLLEYCAIKHRLSLCTIYKKYEIGANHIIEAIHIFLNARRTSSSYFLRTIYAQMNNCARESKNGFMFGCFEYLVRQDVFDDVLSCSYQLAILTRTWTKLFHVPSVA